MIVSLTFNMEVIVFEIESNDEIFQLVDKKFEHFFIHKFNPQDTVEWNKADLKILGLDLINTSVRKMEFDVLTDFEGLKKIIAFNTNQLKIYQFNKPIPDTLLLESLPESSRKKILLQNGFQHSFFIDFEFVTIESADQEYLQSIRKSPVFSKRIEDMKIKFHTK
jgi:hypothetical protein